MKIGLVCPYIYPERGGVAQHVQHLYENLRLRGHDVRIITASHGPQRASEGDILRIGVGFSVPLNGSMGTLTFSPRYISQVRDLLDRDRAQPDLDRSRVVDVRMDVVEVRERRPAEPSDATDAHTGPLDDRAADLIDGMTDPFDDGLSGVDHVGADRPDRPSGCLGRPSGWLHDR